MVRKTSESAFFLIALAFLAVAAHCSHLEIERWQSQTSFRDPYHNKRFVFNANTAKTFSLGFDRFIADLYWLMFVQYYGDVKACRDERFRYAPDYLNVVIKMDPHFIRPYWYAAFVLADDLKQQDEANRVLDEGIRNNPQDWSLPYIAGFNQYLYKKDSKKAAEYYRIAAKVPGAPPWLLDQAEIMDLDIPAYIKEIRTWRRMYLQATKDGDVMVQAKALNMLEILWSRVYWSAPTEKMKAATMENLKNFDLRLLPQKALPKESNDEIEKGSATE